MSTNELHTLLEQSLIAWHVPARVRRGEDGAITVTGLGREISVARAPSAMPFRWLVTIDGRQRPALALVAVLRQVRAALDPGFAPVQVRVGRAAGTRP